MPQAGYDRSPEFYTQSRLHIQTGRKIVWPPSAVVIVQCSCNFGGVLSYWECFGLNSPPSWWEQRAGCCSFYFPRLPQLSHTQRVCLNLYPSLIVTHSSSQRCPLAFGGRVKCVGRCCMADNKVKTVHTSTTFVPYIQGKWGNEKWVLGYNRYLVPLSIYRHQIVADLSQWWNFLSVCGHFCL